MTCKKWNLLYTVGDFVMFCALEKLGFSSSFLFGHIPLTFPSSLWKSLGGWPYILIDWWWLVWLAGLYRQHLNYLILQWRWNQMIIIFLKWIPPGTLIPKLDQSRISRSDLNAPQEINWENPICKVGWFLIRFHVWLRLFMSTHFSSLSLSWVIGLLYGNEELCVQIDVLYNCKFSE